MSTAANVLSVPLDPQLARDLAAAAKRLDEWRTKRDDLIWDAHEKGASLREIAARVGMSNPGVLSVLRREAARRHVEPES